ncbi:hypothetical protein [Lonepinella koalarum]|uniref:Uncharacterized protein n=1 Tax=Lonepinella koalarum TaxID=53417 RepID=A0A4R1KXH5_9PAST|nr:hypothetical protein [Lonepinella koalarum]TCK70105.1 hypothetical protein EV692_1331 [Lonepinella koalarum]
MSYTPLKGRDNVQKPSDGNSGVRFADRTDKVAKEISGGVMPSASRAAKGGCKGCGR